MSVTRDIVRSWRRPREVMRRHLALGRREDRALIFLMVACIIIFVGQWPRLSREAFFDPSMPLDARLGGALFGWLFVAPLAFYVIAALSHMVARLFGGRGSWFGARLALFWSLLAASPLWLLVGLVAGFIGPGVELSVTGAIALLAFLVIWILSLVEAESGRDGG